MRILILELPVHMPTMMPYSITMMKSVLESCLDENIIALDLNAKYHYDKYKEFYLKKQKKDYFEVLEEFVNQARHDYSKISQAVVKGKLPEGHKFLMDNLLEKKPDIVALSLAYNSQIFFAKGILEELNKYNIPSVIGGPADFSKISKKTLVLNNYDDLIEYLKEKGAKVRKNMGETALDFSIYEKKTYFTKEFVYPIRTAYSCPYKLCAFCTHHQNSNYELIDLDFIKRTIEKNSMRKVFFIDDGFSKKRLIEIADMAKSLNIKYWLQLRPEKWVLSLLPKLYDSGLRCIAWGIESGSQRVLDFMEKGTNILDIKNVIKSSKEAGIKNIVYVMFGFPTETKDEFVKTIDFLEKNSEYIDLVSPSIFGLQEGSRAYLDHEKFSVREISRESRTILGDKITFIPKTGLTQSELKELKKKNMYKLNYINKIPKIINSCREQALNL